MTSKNNYKAWIYLAPSLILLIVFALYPLIDTFIISFLKDYNYINGKNNGLTLDNYKVLFQIIPPPSHIPGLSAPISAFFTSALPNTLLITFVTVPISIILALIISDVTGIGAQTGGSTLTQQTVKMQMLSSETTWKRKVGKQTEGLR